MGCEQSKSSEGSVIVENNRKGQNTDVASSSAKLGGMKVVDTDNDLIPHLATASTSATHSTDDPSPHNRSDLRGSEGEGNGSDGPAKSHGAGNSGGAVGGRSGSALAPTPYTMLLLRNRLIETKTTALRTAQSTNSCVTTMTSTIQKSHHGPQSQSEASCVNSFGHGGIAGISAPSFSSPSGEGNPLEDSSFWSSVIAAVQSDVASGVLLNYVDRNTGSTPLHEALKLSNPTVAALKCIIAATGGIGGVGGGVLVGVGSGLGGEEEKEALRRRDYAGCIPLHYGIVAGRLSGEVLQFLIDADPVLAYKYFSNELNEEDKDQESQKFDLNSTMVTTSPLYQAVRLGRSNDVTGAIHAHCPQMLCRPTVVPNTDMGVFVGDGDGSVKIQSFHTTTDDDVNANTVVMDTPMNLLWRRYHNHKFECEKFFPGDNSLPHVVRHRTRYRRLATETRDAIMNMLQVLNNGRIVHAVASLARAAPLDLLQVILVKNPNEIGERDDHGRLPLHYAAMAEPPFHTVPSSAEGVSTDNDDDNDPDSDHLAAGGGGGPGYQGKFVVETLLTLCPSAATVRDNDGKLPLSLAIGKPRTMDMGVVMLLHDAYPDALDSDKDMSELDPKRLEKVRDAVRRQQRRRRKKDDNNNDEYDTASADEDEEASSNVDAMFVVQHASASPNEIIGAMWAHRSDPALQMLALVSLARIVNRARDASGATAIALAGGVSAIVNAMSAHPNEAVVQEKACVTLRLLSKATTSRRRRDRRDEICFSSVGAVTSIVRSMQDNPTDAMVQKEACGALGVLGSDSIDSYTAVVSAGGVGAIVNAMEAHPTEGTVQAEACEALKKLSEFNTREMPMYKNAEELEPLLVAAKESFDLACRESADFVMKKIKSTASS